MNPRTRREHRGGAARDPLVEGPMAWSFDGPFAECLADVEDALRRAIVQVAGAASVSILIEISLPALKRRVANGDRIQPAWRDFLARVSSAYGLPSPPRFRHVRDEGPLATLVVAFRHWRP